MQNVENGVVWVNIRSSAVSPFDGAHMISYSSLRVICHNLPTSTYPTCIWHPVGVTRFEFQKDFWHQKTTVLGLSSGVVCVIIRLTVLVEHRLVTHRHTDRQRAMAYTAQSIARAVIKNNDYQVMSYIVENKLVSTIYSMSSSILILSSAVIVSNLHC